MSPTPHPPATASDRPLIGIAWMLWAGFIVSAMDGIAKWAVGIFPVAQVIFLRSVCVLILMVPLVMRAGGLRALKVRRPGLQLLRAFCSVTSLFCFFESLRLLPLATVIAISFGAPLFMTALSVPFLGEKVGVHRWAAVVVGLVGVIVIAAPSDAGLMSWGAALGIAASLFFATGLVVVRALAHVETDASLMFWQAIGFLVPTAFLAPLDWLEPTAIDIGLIALMAVLITLGQYAMIWAFRAAPVGAVAPFQYVELVWATLIGFTIWRELPAANVWVGSAIVIASGLYVLWRERARAASAK